MINIKFKKLNPDVVLPIPAHEGDAGADVIAMSRTWLEELNCWEYGLGFSTEIPIGYKGIIVPRSSVSKYDLIMCNSPAQVDSLYRGEWKVRFKILKPKKKSDYNIDENGFQKAFREPKIYELGDKIAQIFFEEVLLYHFIETDSLTDTSRGDGGFGSTDKK